MAKYTNVARALSGAAAIAASVVGMGAEAQTTEGNALVDAVVQCRQVEGDGPRLACFEAASAALAGARSTRGLTVLTNREVEQRRRATFGLNGRPVGEATPSRTPLPQVDTLDSTVVRAVQAGRDLFVVTLADKSVWRTTESTRSWPRPGQPVHIKRAALGSYLGSFDKARSVRIQRVR